MRYESGPAVRDRVLRTCGLHRDGGVSYAYVDHKGTRVPEYAATHVRVVAYRLSFSKALAHELSETIKAMPGHVSSTVIDEHPTLRPQVIAVFDRTWQA